MAKFVANPVEIEAHEITDVSPARDDGLVGRPWQVYIAELGGWIPLAGHMTVHRAPQAGDWLIFQSDDDQYICPKEVFEQKYRKQVVRLTQADIEAKVKETIFIRPAGTLTVCVLTLTNGFHVVGKSACLDPAAFDEELGKKIAYEDALRQVWQLAGYLATEKMHRERIGCDCAGRYDCGCQG